MDIGRAAVDREGTTGMGPGHGTATRGSREDSALGRCAKGAKPLAGWACAEVAQWDAPGAVIAPSSAVGCGKQELAKCLVLAPEKSKLGNALPV
jgi:hypothetical protein